MRAALGTFLTTDVGYRGRGLARRLVSESVLRLRAKEYAGYFFYLQRGRASGPVYRQTAFPCDLVATGVRIYFRILDSRALASSWEMGWIERTAMRWMEGGALNNGSSSTVRPFVAADLGACLRLLNESSRSAYIARQWQERELLWRLTGYPKSVALVLEEQGAVRGLFSAYVTEVLGSRWGTARPRAGATGREPAGFIDNLVVEGLSAGQTRALLVRGLSSLKGAGCTVAVGPSLLVTAKAPFLRSRFIPDVFTSPLDLRFARLQDEVEPISARGRVCLDVL
jgi:hypothetical protein